MAAKAKVVVKEADRPILYPDIVVNGIVIPREKLKITARQMKELLKWETEPDYKERMKKENPDAKAAEAAEYGDDYLLKNTQGEKVRCWNNVYNRPFTESHAKEIAQVILNKDWRMNCEAMIVSETGQCQSIQHRGVGLILAVEEWNGKNKEHWREIWQEEPYIESILIQGASDDPKTVMTLDNVRARSMTDVIFTSEIFSRKKLDATERKECSRMLAVCIDFLWKRTGQGMASIVGTFHQYQTHSESLRFLDRHPTIQDCVSEIFSCNKDRDLSKMMLSPGICAGSMYLMGSAKSDPDAYRKAAREEVDKLEKELDWELFDKAKEFWALIGTSAEFSHVRTILKDLATNETEDEGLGGKVQEKLAVLALAWQAFAEAPPATVIHSNQVSLTGKYIKTDDGVKKLNAPEANFGGIDLGDLINEKEGKPTAGEATAEEVEAAKEVLKEEKLARIKKLTEERKARKDAIAAKPKVETVTEAQTRRAREADELLAKQKGNGAPAAPASKKPVLRGGTN